MNIQTLIVIGFILFIFNLNFGKSILFIPLAINFIVAIALRLKINHKLRDADYKKVKNKL